MIWLVRAFITLVIFFQTAAQGLTSDPLVMTDDSTTIGGGARPLGMGRAFVGVADDADAPFINPAGIAGIRSPQVMSMFTNLLGEVYYVELSGVIPAPFGTMGAGYIATGVNQVLTPISSTESVYTDYHDNLFLLTYSTPLARFFDYGRNFYVGVNAKVFTRGWSGGVSQSALGYSVDLGLKYVATPYLSFGFNRQNILPVALGGVLRWPSGAEEAVAGLYKLGLAVKPKQFSDKLLLAADLDLPAQSGRPITAHLGAEWKIHQFFTVRGGADQSVDAATSTRTSWNPTIGASLGIRGVRVDYAYHPYYNDPALATNYISLSYQGDSLFALTGETQ